MANQINRQREKGMITHAEVLKRYIYHADGYLTYRRVVSNRVKEGGSVGYVHSSGYLRTEIKGKRYRIHRLIFLYHHGYMPTQTDHINGIRDDNRISNLRDVSVSENNKNQKIPCNNTSGHMGVTWDKARKKWLAHIMVCKKAINLGRFKDIDDAITARKAGEIQYGFHKNHGRKG